ncbi:MAG: bifunctional nuclease family protein [Candidatus Aenigmarchaeota archaeon]|nr:bifunctional nuclease family protein [Candidatus Aenigmarchaeota archaeon]
MKNEERTTKIIVIVLIIVLAGMAAYAYLPDLLILPNLSTVGLVPINVEIDATGPNGIVTLTGGCYQIKANVEKEQAISMLNGLNKVVGPRPNTHDLFKDTLNTLDAKILMIKITDLREDAYISKMVVRKGNTLLSLDSRPSDAIAIALRGDYKVPVYMNETLLKKDGAKIC